MARSAPALHGHHNLPTRATALVGRDREVADLRQVGLRIGRWILPWVAVLFVSATLAYAVNGAIAGGSSAGD